jgi:hypothetical protein
MFGEQMKWTGWEDIKKWAQKNGFKNLVARMQLNNDSWMSSGEFGRSQRDICDTLRFAKDEQEALEMASAMDSAFSENFGLW